MQADINKIQSKAPKLQDPHFIQGRKNEFNTENGKNVVIENELFIVKATCIVLKGLAFSTNEHTAVYKLGTITAQSSVKGRYQLLIAHRGLWN